MRAPHITITHIYIILSAILISFGMPPVHAAGYHPEQKVVFKGKQKNLLRDAVQAFNALPELGRQAMIANRLELYYSEEGNSRYNDYMHWPNPGGKFVGADGNVREWHLVRDNIPPVQWDAADRKIWDLGANAVFPAVAKEVTAVIYATAKEIVNSMPPELRDSWLAEEAGLLYSTTGGKAYGRGYDTTTTDSGKEVKRRKLTGLYDLRFIDAEGKEQAFGTVLATHAKIWERRRKILYLCIQYTSRKEILDLFSSELNTLRKNAKDAQKGEEAGDDDDPPKTSANAKLKDAMFPLPNDAQEAFLAELTGMCYMADGTNALAKKRVKAGARYIGSDGEEHEVLEVLSKVPEADMNKARDAFRSASKSAIISTFKPKLAAMAHQAAPAILTTMPDVLRDAWLSEVAELLFTANNSKAYTGKTGAVRTETGVEVRFKSLTPQSRFVDAKGGEHSTAEREPLWKKWGKRWTILHFCAQVGGKEKIFEALALEMDALRQAHSKVTGTPYTPPADLAERRKSSSATALGDRQAPTQPVTTAKGNSSLSTPSQTLPTTAPRIAPPSPSDTPAVALLKKMDSTAREAKLAEMLGICFMDDASMPVNSDRKLRENAQYIGSDGKKHDFYESQRRDNDQWAQLALLTRDMEQQLEAILCFPELVTQMLLHSAQYQLNNLPEFLRDAWLAEYNGLLFVPESLQSAYADSLRYGTMHTGFRLPYKAFRGAPVYRDAKGTQRTYLELRPSWQEHAHQYEILTLCSSMLGVEKIAALVPELMATLRKNNSEASKHIYMPLPAILGTSTFMQQKLARTVSTLKHMPKETREVWLCETMGLFFMEDGSTAVTTNNWMKYEAMYIGSDGQKYNVYQSMIKGHFDWIEVGKHCDSSMKFIVLKEFRDLCEQICQQTAKYLLLGMSDFDRELFLAEIGGYLYIPDGADCAYTNACNVLYTDNGQIAFRRRVRGNNIRFRDSNGVEHAHNEGRNAADQIVKRRAMLHMCVTMAGADKITELFPDIMQKLRANNPLAAKHSVSPLKPLLRDSDASSQVGLYLDSQPSDEIRDAWLSESMGFIFMKDGSFVINENKKLKNEVYFIDSQGNTRNYYDYKYSFIWDSLSTFLPYGNRILPDDLREKQERLALETIKHCLLTMPQLMRDAWLCEQLGLLYIPNSKDSPYDSDLYPYKADNGNTLFLKHAKASASFTDTQGAQHSMTERQPYWEAHSRHWDVACVALKYCPLSKALTSFTAEVSRLRKNYESATKKKAPESPIAPGSSSSSGSRKTGMGSSWF